MFIISQGLLYICTEHTKVLGLVNNLSTAIKLPTVYTLPTAEILGGKNARAFLVCCYLIKSNKKSYPENMKKIMGAIWKLSSC